MANRFDRYVQTEYVGMPVDYYQAALAAKEQEAQLQLNSNVQRIRAYNQITPIGADAKALQRQLMDRMQEGVRGIAKKDLRTQGALDALRNIVNDPEAIGASRNFLQDIAEYTKGQEDYAGYVKDNPNDVNALPYLRAVYKLNQQQGKAENYKQGAFSNLGPYTKYYDWKKIYNELANKVGISGTYKDTPIPGNYIWGHSAMGKSRKQIHDAVMQQMGSDSDAMRQIQQELEYNAFKSNPNNPNQYYDNVRIQDVENNKARFDQIMSIKTNLNDPTKAKEMRAQFRQRYIDAGKTVPSKKEFDKAYGAARVAAIKEANAAMFQVHTDVREIAGTDSRSYATEKYINRAVNGIADLNTTSIIKDTLKADMARIHDEDLNWKKTRFAAEQRALSTLFGSDNNVRVDQGNFMPKGDAYTAPNDPKIFKGTPLEGVNDDGTPKVDAGPGTAMKIINSVTKWGIGLTRTHEERDKAMVEEDKANAEKNKQQSPQWQVQQAKKASAWLEENYGTALGPAPYVTDDPLLQKQEDRVKLYNYIAAGKKLVGDVAMKGQLAAPTLFHLDPLSGAGGKPAPYNSMISENLDLSEHIYTEGASEDEKTDLLSTKRFVINGEAGHTLKEAIAASNGVTVATNTKFGLPALRYELPTKEDGTQVIYVEQRPDRGGPISKIMETYGVTSMDRNNKPGATFFNLQGADGKPESVVVESRLPMTQSEGGRQIFDQNALGLQNYVYEDPNHPILEQYAKQIMKDAGFKPEEKHKLVAFVNNAYEQYLLKTNGYTLDPATNMITTPSGIKTPPMKYIRVNNDGVTGMDRYVLVAPQVLNFSTGTIGGTTKRSLLDIQKRGFQNMINDPAIQYFKRNPMIKSKNASLGSYLGLFSPESEFPMVEEAPMPDDENQENPQ